MNRMNEVQRIDCGLLPQSISAGNEIGDYYSLKDHRQALAIGSCGALTSGQTLTVSLMEAEDTDGTNAQALTSATATYTAPAEGVASAVVYVEVEHFSLSDGFNSVAVKVATTATIECAAILLRGDPRESVSQDATGTVL